MTENKNVLKPQKLTQNLCEGTSQPANATLNPQLDFGAPLAPLSDISFLLLLSLALNHSKHLFVRRASAMECADSLTEMAFP